MFWDSWLGENTWQIVGEYVLALMEMELHVHVSSTGP